MSTVALTGSSIESSKMSEDEKEDREDDRSSPHHDSKSSFWSKWGSNRQSDDYDVGKDNNGQKRVKFIRPMNSLSTAAMHFNNSRLQKRS